MSKKQDSFIRFSLQRRIEHIVLFTSFIILAVTGMPQKYHNLDGSQRFVQFLGGIETVRVIHHWAAVFLIAISVFHLVNGLYLLIVKRLRFSMLPTGKDGRDIAGMVKYFVGSSAEKPKFGRYSFIEKFDYWAVFWGMFIMAGSGLILWFPVFFTGFLPGVAVPMSKVAHSDEALLAVTAIVVWHMYNAHFNPRIFPFNPTIFTGKISNERMIEEHPLELEDAGELSTAALAKLEEADLELAIPWSNIVISGLMGVVTVGLLGWMIVLALH